MTTASGTGAGTTTDGGVFSADERAAMKAAAAEQRAAARRGKGAEKAAAEERDALEKIAEMSEPDRVLAERVHEIVTSTSAELLPKTWYGMPAYARNGKVVCFFKPKDKFKARYATLGFSDEARLDDGTMWPTEFALTAIGDAEAAAIVALLERALARAPEQG